MPAEVCRTSPARSISRCEAICASAGVSFMVGMKLRERRIAGSVHVVAGRRTVTGGSADRQPATVASATENYCAPHNGDAQ